MSDKISVDERIHLKNLMNEMNYEDNTDSIRKLKHSSLIRDDIRTLEQLKKGRDQAMDDDAFFQLAQEKCAFLYNNYTDLFARSMKNELDLVIMTKMLIVLKMIEDDKLDQQEGSVMVGRYLKELYLDSAIKRADNLDKEREAEKVQPIEGKKVSWKQYKQSQKYIEKTV